jgi:hypothetical protein
MKLKHGKTEIGYLLTKVFEKYEQETGELVVRNTNRKNYEAVAKKLSLISNELPNTHLGLDHDVYTASHNLEKLDYPSNKYDITASQIKDASLGLVSNPRNFLIDACYIYLYGKGRKGFEKSPIDSNLIVVNKNELSEQVSTNNEPITIPKNNVSAIKENNLNNRESSSSKNKYFILKICIASLCCLLAIALYKLISTNNDWKVLKKDMNLLPYKPTKAEVDSLEGIWLCYTGSPQARSSNPNRYHQVVSNIVDIKNKNGYFLFTRYGASFDHTGYMQFESPGLVSIHSQVKNDNDNIESPRHSLLRLEKNKKYLPAISASWSFDVGDKNSIIGIREVYIKLGKAGTINEVINTLENASCRCKIINWKNEQNEQKIFYLRNEILDSLQDSNIKNLIDENSILPSHPTQGLIIMKDTLLK